MQLHHTKLSPRNTWQKQEDFKRSRLYVRCRERAMLWTKRGSNWLHSTYPSSINENYQNNPCADRESNPGQMLGRHLCYHYTIGAMLTILPAELTIIICVNGHPRHPQGVRELRRHLLSRFTAQHWPRNQPPTASASLPRQAMPITPTLLPPAY